MSDISYSRATNLGGILIIYLLTMIAGIILTFIYPKFGLFYTVFAFTRMKLNLRGLDKDMKFTVEAGMLLMKLAPALIWVLWL